MAEISYRLIQEKGQYFIQAGVGEIENLSLSSLKSFATEKDFPIIKFLERQAKNQSVLTSEVMRQLAQTGRLFQEGKKVVLDPFTRLDLFFEITQCESEEFLIEGFLRGPTQTLSLARCQGLFPGTPPCILCGRLLQNLSRDISSHFLFLAFPKHSTCTRKELALLIDELKEEEEDAPEFLLLGDAEQEETRPILKLKDRSGAFGDLWITYNHQKQVAIHDETKYTWRRWEEEKHWERDLLETDFQAKIVDSSHYYCPMDKVVQSLTFLLEMGWKIMDYQGREVVRQGALAIEVGDGNGVFTFKGHVSYGEHKADVKNIVGAFNRRERFIELSRSEVGLLDVEKNPLHELGDDARIEEEGIALAKQKIGVGINLFNHPAFTLREEITSLLHRLTATSLSSHPIPPAESFQGTLHPYQQEGMNWLYALYENRLGALLADEMGLGKTVQVIALLSRLSRNNLKNRFLTASVLPQNFDPSSCFGITAAPILIIAPTSLLFHWRKELEKFLPHLSVYIHAGDRRARTSEELKNREVILTSYALARMDHALFYNLRFGIIILDEAQVIKNPLSQTAEVVSRLQGSFRLAITGTPIENRHQDLFSIFHFLLPGLLGDRATFQAKVLAGQSDERYFHRMRQLIKPFILRRRKELVASQLPPKIEQVIWVEMEEEQRVIYEEKLRSYKQGVIKKIREDTLASHRMEVLEAILRLRQICCHPRLADPSLPYNLEDSAKLQKLIEDVEAIVAEGRKALIYSQFTSMLHLIEREVKSRGLRHVLLDGSTKDREGIVRQFQEDPSISLFLLSLKAGGVGLNLTAADYVLLYDPWWNNAVETQAIDRAHRLGRSDQVVARRYVVALTIEEKIMKVKEHKSTLIDELLTDGTDSAEWKIEDLLALIED